MTDPTAAFFEDLQRRDYEPLLAHKKGSVRFELADDGRTERWLVAFDDGDIGVSNRNQAADTTIRAEKSLFDEIVRGDANAVTAFLRGVLSIEGDLNLVVLFQRLFPSPSASASRRPVAAAQGRKS